MPAAGRTPGEIAEILSLATPAQVVDIFADAATRRGDTVDVPGGDS